MKNVIKKSVFVVLVLVVFIPASAFCEYGTLNPEDKVNVSLSNGNLTASIGSIWGGVRGTIRVPATGKWYFEARGWSTPTGSSPVDVGFCEAGHPLAGETQYGVHMWDEFNLRGGGVSGSIPRPAITTVQIAIDRDNGNAWLGLDNVWYTANWAAGGDPAAGLNPTWTSIPEQIYPAVHLYNNQVMVNFGQAPFTHTPPAGFTALTTGWVQSGDDIYSQIARVGIGTDTPRTSLDVAGTILADKIGIGTTAPQSKLAVNGTITAKEVVVTIEGWADYVFDDAYPLKPLPQLESYIKANHHLPGIPSANELKQAGLPVADILTKQMQKIEELTLYLIDLEKSNAALQRRLEKLEHTQMK